MKKFLLIASISFCYIYIACTGNSPVSETSLSLSPVLSNVNADLRDLTVSSGTLSPVFSANTTNYTLEVGYVTSLIDLTPTVDAAGATVKVNGVTVSSGNASGEISLSVGSSNVIIISVKAPDNVTTKEYRITVTRVEVSNNANLSNITVSKGNIGTFDPAVTAYTDSVAYSDSSITVNPTVAGVGATVTVNGIIVNSGSESGIISLINLAPLTNTITIFVTAQDDVTTKTYTITVTRDTGNNADLSALTVSMGKLQPAFTSANINYLDAPIPYSVTSSSITPTSANSSATIKVDGSTITSGSAVAKTLVVGKNYMNIEVTAENGTTTKTYTICMYRAIPVFKTGAGSITGYTLAAGEDGHTDMQWGLAWPNPRFTKDDGAALDGSEVVIKDQITGLSWLKNGNIYTSYLNWPNALTYISNYVNVTSKPGNFTDWRLPNNIELASLVNYGQPNPVTWLGTQGFTNVLGAYWTSTTYAAVTNWAWYGNMYTGTITAFDKTNAIGVWMLRGGQ